ncbi:hypothetical protein D3C80_1220890 [compost metagenome]
MVELSVGSIRQTRQAIRNAFVVIHRTTEVEAHATLALSTYRGLNLMVRGKEWLLGGQGYQATRRASPVQYRRRSLENVDALKKVWVYLHCAVGAVVSH